MTLRSIKPAVGLFGGSFNPVHLGHVETAQSVLQQLKLDKMIFLPAALSPFKQKISASEQQRADMLGLAISGHDQLEVDTREFGGPPPSYTVDTLQSLHLDYPSQQWVFVMGMDAWKEFAQWHQPERILELVNIVVMTRSGYEEFSSGDLGVMVKSTEELFWSSVGRVLQLRVPVIEASSSHIRRLIIAGDDYGKHLRSEVATYIAEQNLYHD